MPMPWLNGVFPCFGDRALDAILRQDKQEKDEWEKEEKCFPVSFQKKKGPKQPEKLKRREEIQHHNNHKPQQIRA
jgi:hypothetical protein